MLRYSLTPIDRYLLRPFLLILTLPSGMSHRVAREQDRRQLPTSAEPPSGPIVEVELLTLHFLTLRPARRNR